MIQQLKHIDSFFYKRFDCFVLILCCIVFLFSINFSKAQEPPINENQDSISSKVFIVSETFITNIEQLKGVTEIKYVENKKHKAIEKKKTSKPIKLEISATPKKIESTNSGEYKLIVKVSPVKKGSDLYNLKKKIFTATIVSGKTINKFKTIENQSICSKVIPELLDLSIDRISIFCQIKQEHYLKVCRTRPPPPVC